MKRGHPFIHWIGLTLWEKREQPGVPREYLSDILGVSERTLRRFEGQDGPERQSYVDVDRVVGAYALALGYGDARDLWQCALSRWMREDEPPLFDLELPDQEFVEPIQRAARQGRQQSRSGRQGKPPASRTRRAG
jgi:hypothetical protein